MRDGWSCLAVSRPGQAAAQKIISRARRRRKSLVVSPLPSRLSLIRSRKFLAAATICVLVALRWTAWPALCIFVRLGLSGFVSYGEFVAGGEGDGCVCCLVAEIESRIHCLVVIIVFGRLVRSGKADDAVEQSAYERDIADGKAAMEHRPALYAVVYAR